MHVTKNGEPLGSPFGVQERPKRLTARSCALRRSSSRSRGGAFVWKEWIRRCAAAVTSSTARSNTAVFAWEGRAVPLSLRTNCSADARISSSVAGGAKFARVFMLRHMLEAPPMGFKTTYERDEE